MINYKVPRDIRVNTIHKSNNWGDFIITCYVNALKVGIYFIGSKNEYFVASAHIRTGKVSDSEIANKHKSTKLTQDRIINLLDYDQFTGEFTWKIQRRHLKIGDKAGHLRSDGYIYIKVDGKTYLAHRLAWLYMAGEWPSDEIDHINHRKNDNRITNIRVVTHVENSKNKSLSINNTSGCIGVCFDKARNKWRSNIRANGKAMPLGDFTDKNDAVIARKMAEIKYGFHENHGSNSTTL